MKLGWRYDGTMREVASARIDPKRAKFRLDPRLLRRILLWALPFPLLAALVPYLGQPAWMMVLPLAWGSFAVLWQIIAYGLSGGRITPQQLSATHFYSRRALIFAAVCWTVIITFVCVALYLKFPDG